MVYKKEQSNATCIHCTCICTFTGTCTCSLPVPLLSSFVKYPCIKKRGLTKFL